MKEENPLPKRLRELRTMRGLSQKQLGIDAGIDEFSASPRINQYEKGKHTPDYLTLKKLANVLKSPTAYFYAEEDNLAIIILWHESATKDEKTNLIKVVTSRV